MALFLFCAAVFAAVGTVGAATFTVTKLADTDDGVCDADCSLREAVNAANNDAGVETIKFASPLFDSARTITLDPALGELRITESVIVAGPGAKLLTISGNDAVRVFNINDDVVVTISGVTIAHGNSGSSVGGGILNGVT